jgi:hypothetical protein
VSFVVRYSAVPRIALASAKESFGFLGLLMVAPDGEAGEVARASRKLGMLVNEGDLAVLVLVGEGPAGRCGVSEAISVLGQLD